MQSPDPTRTLTRLWFATLIAIIPVLCAVVTAYLVLLAVPAPEVSVVWPEVKAVGAGGLVLWLIRVICRRFDAAFQPPK